MTDVAGNRANQSGKGLEATVKVMLDNAGFTELVGGNKKAFVQQGGVMFSCPDKFYIQQVRITENIYGAKAVSDFYLYHHTKYPKGLIIECKWQGSAGSVDEKYVFTVLSLKELPQDSILILDGIGARACAVRWIHNQTTKQFKFMTLAEFMQWTHDHL